MVDPGLSAYGRIYLREQGGGNLDERYAAQIGGGRKTGQVADDSASQCNQRCPALAAVFQQCIKDQIQRFPVFVPFAVGRVIAKVST